MDRGSQFTMNSAATTRTGVKDASLEKSEHCADVGAVILLIVNVIALVLLFFHVANR
jgi:hypothetical protein